MITVPFSLVPYLVDATALGQGYIQVIVPKHIARSMHLEADQLSPGCEAGPGYTAT
jgi:hypothetical protein